MIKFKKKSINKNTYFYDLRDDDGELIKNQGLKLNAKITETVFLDILKNDFYKYYKKKINNQYFDNFLKKEIFYQILPISNQIIIINNLLKKNNQNKFENFIIELTNLKKQKNFFFFFCNEYNNLFLSHISKSYKGDIIFKNELSFYKIFYFIKKSQILKNNFIFFLFKKLNLYFYNFKNSLNFNNKNYIAVTFGEGIDINKRSDLYWFNQEKFNGNKIFIYFEDIKKYKKNKKKIDILKNRYGIKSFYIPRGSFYKKNKINLLKYNINNNLFSKENFFKYIINQFIFNYCHYYNFFKKSKVKIHVDHHERASIPIIKQAAIKNIGSCSFGKMRSYQDNVMGKLYFSFPNDIHFLWGIDAYKRIKNKIDNKCENIIPNIILNGYSHTYNKKNIVKNLPHYTKFLFIDTNSDTNDSYIEQLVDKNYLNELYEKFFRLIIKFNNLHLTIKRKKNDKIKNLENNNYLFNKALKTNRLILISDSIGMPVSDISENIDYIFALTTEDIPSALIECLNKKNRGIIIDYTNLKKNEEKIYNYGKNNIIFNDIDALFLKLEKYLTQNKFDDNFGNWSDILNDFKHFIDNNGSKRVSEYIYELISNINKEDDVQNAIYITNKRFVKKYGPSYIKT